MSLATVYGTTIINNVYYLFFIDISLEKNELVKTWFVFAVQTITRDLVVYPLLVLLALD